MPEDRGLEENMMGTKLGRSILFRAFSTEEMDAGLTPGPCPGLSDAAPLGRVLARSRRANGTQLDSPVRSAGVKTSLPLNRAC
jgi:hypothetical protein